MGRLLKLLGGNFNPLSISGLQLWLSSRYASSMLQERSSATTLASANGDPIGTWHDLSGNGRNVTASSDSTRPTVATSAQNGLPGIKFDGTNDFLSVSSNLNLAGSAEATLFIVLKADSTASGDRYHVGTSSGVTNRFAWASGGNRIYPSIGGSGSAYGQFNDTSNTFLIGSLTYDGTATPKLIGYVNGTNKNITIVGSLTATIDSFSTFYIGKRETASSESSATICEILAYSKILSTAQRKQVERYLGSIWGITVS